MYILSYLPGIPLNQITNVVSLKTYFHNLWRLSPPQEPKRLASNQFWQFSKARKFTKQAGLTSLPQILLAPRQSRSAWRLLSLAWSQTGQQLEVLICLSNNLLVGSLLWRVNHKRRALPFRTFEAPSFLHLADLLLYGIHIGCYNPTW